MMGRQLHLAAHMKQVVKQYLPLEKPKSIVVLSAHWESDPIKISSAEAPKMYYDYSGFPPETYKYQYPAPGSPQLATKIHSLFEDNGIPSELDPARGFDHGVFVPLMLMYPDADIPVVCVSLHSSLSADTNMEVGAALQPLRDEGVLILGSGYTFHNMHAFFNPSPETHEASKLFNEWLKTTITGPGNVATKLSRWEQAPGARVAHPREEHLMPLLIVMAAGGIGTTPKVIFDLPDDHENHAVSGYLFE